MLEILLALTLLLLVVAVALLAMVRRQVGALDLTPVLARLEAAERGQAKIEQLVLDEMGKGRASDAQLAAGLRQEIGAQQKGANDSLVRTLGEIGGLQKTQLEALSARLEKLTDSNEKRMEALRIAVEGKLASIQEDNTKKLEQIRATVDEKLQGVLEKRLGESFKSVSERLEQVHRGLGEMQTLATGVGDLRKVLTNVKTRGIWGEVQLGNLLEQMLTPEQFERNVQTKVRSPQRVEFAIKLPGKDGEIVWLPIDAKFPQEDYHRLQEAADRGDVEAVAAATHQLGASVRASAREICDKYLNPPKTTDFAFLYLPTEGLYAEVVRMPGLIELIQRECRVNLVGPTTLAATLNALQMGFRTLAIQKRSSEVWRVLSAVKSEFAKFEDIVDKVKDKLQQAYDTIDTGVAKRTRQIQQKLRKVSELPAAEAALIIDEPAELDAVEPEVLEREDPVSNS